MCSWCKDVREFILPLFTISVLLVGVVAVAFALLKPPPATQGETIKVGSAVVPRVTTDDSREYV